MPLELDLRQKQKIRRRRFGVNDPYAGYLLYDSVTRADSTTSPGTPTEKGTAWTAATGTWGVLSNKLYVPAGTTEAYLVNDIGTSECTVTANIITDLWATNQPGIILRYIDSSNFILIRMSSTTTTTVFKRVAGSFTSLGAQTFSAITDGTAATFAASSRGNVITLSVNGVAASGTITLAGADATQFGSGTSTKIGFRSQGSAAERFSLVKVAP